MLSRRASRATVLGLVPPRAAAHPSPRSDRGQASVELLAAVPFVLVVGAIVWQLAVAGQAAWLCANAARVAARAEAVGRDGEAAARSALPRHLERRLEVTRENGGRVRVRVGIPLVLHASAAPVSVAAAARLENGR